MNAKSELDLNNIPKHVAIIMDGNGRWAKERKLPRVMGHKVGTESVKIIVKAAKELGISVLTLYAFSTENWKRPSMEVQALMTLLKTYLKSELSDMLQNNISLRCIGQMEKLPGDVQEILVQVINETANLSGMSSGLILNLALSYGGREEITMAAKAVAEQCIRGEISTGDISEELFSSQLYTAGLPDPDLVIRTGGESRLSNFLLWQASYAEIYITETKWPDFRKGNLIEAIKDFQERERRYGKTSEQVKEN